MFDPHLFDRVNFCPILVKEIIDLFGESQKSCFDCRGKKACDISLGYINVMVLHKQHRTGLYIRNYIRNVAPKVKSLEMLNHLRAKKNLDHVKYNS